MAVVGDLLLFMWSTVCLTSLDRVVQWLLLVAGTKTGTYSVVF